jgi:hypothetical protein
MEQLFLTAIHSCDETMRVFFHYKGEMTAKTVNPTTDTPCFLFPALPHPVFIHEEQILAPGFSFDFLKIQPDSHILVLDELPKPKRKQQASYAPFEGDVESRLQWFFKTIIKVSCQYHGLPEPPDASVILENARLHDLAFRKTDGNRRQFRKGLKLLNRPRSPPETTESPTLITPKPDAPSTTEFPVMWEKPLSP